MHPDLLGSLSPHSLKRMVLVLNNGFLPPNFLPVKNGPWSHEWVPTLYKGIPPSPRIPPFEVQYLDFYNWFPPLESLPVMYSTWQEETRSTDGNDLQSGQLTLSDARDVLLEQLNEILQK